MDVKSLSEKELIQEMKEAFANSKMIDPHLRPNHPVPSDGIVLGITQDVVLAEIIELLRLRLMSILKIPSEAVNCEMAVSSQGKIIPEIQIDTEAAEGLTPDQIRDVVQSVWWGVQPVRPGIRDELEERLQDLRSRREQTKAPTC